MKCSKCGKKMDTKDKETKTYIPAYQVRKVHFSIGEYSDIESDKHVGYYCSECLSKGVEV